MEQERRDLGRRVERARLLLGWSKEHAARVAGISAITWKRVEDGQSVQDAKRFAVMRAVGIADLRDAPPGVDERERAELVKAIEAAHLDEATRDALLRTLKEAQ